MKDTATPASVSPAKSPKSFFNTPGEKNFFSGNDTLQSGERFFNNTGVQAKLAIGRPDDVFEKQADAAADRVVSRSGNALPPVQAKSAVGEEEKLSKKEKEEKKELETSDKKVQKAPIFESNEHPPETDKIQTKGDPGGESDTASSSLQSELGSTKGSGSALPEQTRQSMESSFGTDFSGVRVHTGSDSVKMNNELGAQAFTHGNDIYFNEGKYNPQSSSGEHLLAHELTHTVQQGASVRKKEQVPRIQAKASASKTPAPVVAPVALSDEVIDISAGTFAPSEKLKEQIKSAKTKKGYVNVKFADIASGIVEVRYNKSQEFFANNQSIPLNIKFFAGKSITPVLLFSMSKNAITKCIGSVAAGGKAAPDIASWIKGNAAELGWLGFNISKIDKIVNKAENGVFQFGLTDIPVHIGGFVEGTFTLILQNNTVTFNAAGKINVPKLATADLNVTRDENGNLSGGVKVDVAIKDFTGSIDAQYKNGNLNIEGDAAYSTTKLKGNVHIIVSDAATAKAMAMQQIDPTQVAADASAAAAPAAAPAKAGKGNAKAVAGWGNLDFHFTDWLSGNAKVIMDPQGHVTVIGQIAPQKEVTLFSQKNFNKPIFDLEAKATYGIPVVGDVFMFAKVALSAIAVLGPAVIKDIIIDGTYSSDPAVPNHISMSAVFNVSAYAGLRLTAQGGIGIEILSHDIKFGAELNADLGVKGYAEAKPTIGWREKAAGGEGEFFINGHAEIAAQPVLGLSGNLFLDLDTPWWSPLSDGRYWEQPLFSKEWPLPGEFGLGVDMGDYVFGSGKMPDIQFSEVSFDKDKFISDLTDGDLAAGGNKDKEVPGKFVDKGVPPSPPPPTESKEGSGDAKAPQAKGGKGGGGKKGNPNDGDTKKKGANLKDGMAAVKKLEHSKPMTKEEISGAIGNIGNQYNIPVTFSADGTDKWKVTVNMGKGSKTPVLVPAIIKPGDEKEPTGNDKEKQGKLDAGIKALKDEDKKVAGDGKLTKDEADKVANTAQDAHSEIFSSIKAIDGGHNWKYHYIQRNPQQGEVTGSEESLGDLPKIGPHPVSGGPDSQSHHVPAKAMAPVFADFYTEIGDSLSSINGFKPFASIVNEKGLSIRNSLNSNGNGLSAISLHKDTHKEGGDGVHNVASMDAVQNEIKKTAKDSENFKVIIYTQDGDHMIGNLFKSHWNSFIHAIYNIEAGNVKAEEKDGTFVIKLEGANKNVKDIARDFEEKAKAKLKEIQGTEKEAKGISDITNSFKGNMRNAIEKSFDMAVDNGIVSVRVALSKSKIDGDNKGHASILTELKGEAKRLWGTIITQMP